MCFNTQLLCPLTNAVTSQLERALPTSGGDAAALGVASTPALDPTSRDLGSPRGDAARPFVPEIVSGRLGI